MKDIANLLKSRFVRLNRSPLDIVEKLKSITNSLEVVDEDEPLKIDIIFGNVVYSEINHCTWCTSTKYSYEDVPKDIYITEFKIFDVRYNDGFEEMLLTNQKIPARFEIYFDLGRQSI